MSIKNNRLLAVSIITTAVVLISGCTQGLDISDDDLVERISECLAVENKTPGMAVSCGNFQKECLRRGKASGNYIC